MSTDTATALRAELAALGAHLAPARRAEVDALAATLPDVADPAALAEVLARVADLAATEAAERMAHPAVAASVPGDGNRAKLAALAACGAAALAGRLAADYAAGVAS